MQGEGMSITLNSTVVADKALNEKDFNNGPALFKKGTRDIHILVLK